MACTFVCVDTFMFLLCRVFLDWSHRVHTSFIEWKSRRLVGGCGSPPPPVFCKHKAILNLSFCSVLCCLSPAFMFCSFFIPLFPFDLYFFASVLFFVCRSSCLSAILSFQLSHVVRTGEHAPPNTHGRADLKGISHPHGPSVRSRAPPIQESGPPAPKAKAQN